jgi:serine/threonine-protein kinase
MTIPPGAMPAGAPPTGAVGPGAPTLDHPGPRPDQPAKPAKPHKPAPLRNPVQGYEILAELGRGGMGVVYKARQKSLNRVVALKMVIAGEYASPEACVRFLGEAEVVASLHHPNIIQVYEFGNHEGYPYFTLEYVEGGSLDMRLDGTPWPAAEAAETIETLARAIRAAHKKGIVHRDLKPGNILLDAEGTLKVTDFGLAKRVKGASGLTQSGSIVGTPSYMAPEQAAGRNKAIGTATDIYALGAILYELVTGRPPFKAETPVDTIMQLVEQEPVPPTRLNPKCPRDLETICLKCLQKEPAKRYDTAKELADDLRRFRDGEPIKARPIGRRERLQRWVRKRPAAAALIAVSALAAVALLVVGWTYNLHLKSALKDAEVARQATEEQRKKALDNAAEAERQREEAKRQGDLVADGLGKRLDSIENLIQNIDGRLAMAAGMGTIRLEFLNETLGLTQQLLRDYPKDARARRQAGRVYANLGQLLFTRGDFNHSAEALAEARKLQEGLVTEFPKEPSYQNDLTVTYERQGILYLHAKRYDDSLSCYQRAAAVQDGLAAHSPDAKGYVAGGSYYRFRQADVLDEKGDVAAALPLYRKAYEEQTALVREAAKVPAFQTQRAATATSLGYALAESSPAEAQQWFERAVEASHDAHRLNVPDAAARRNLALAYGDLAEFLKRRGDHAGLVKLAERLRQDFPGVALETYNAGCYLANAIAVVKADSALAAPERDRLAELYATSAVVLLEQAVEEGHTEREHMTIDADLDVLRPRTDFKEFWSRLESRFPNKAVRPERVLLALRDDYNNKRSVYEQLDKSTSTAGDRKRARVIKPSFAAAADRMLKLVEKGPDLPTSVDVLAWTLGNLKHADKPEEAVAVEARALALLEKDHVKKKNFTAVCRVLARNPSPAGDKLLSLAAGANPDPDVRAQAAWALAQSLAYQSDQAYDRGDSRAPVLTQQAEEQLEKVIKECSDVAVEAGSLGEVARQRLYELRSLSQGRPARPIAGEDMEGVTMRLADFKGQVVLLDFWANWCGYCRQMYPAERGLVRGMQGRPFALLGVNCDKDREGVDRAVMERKVTWRSWRDDNAVLRGQWQVDAYPTIYLIDHEGVIRKKWVGKPDSEELKAAVEELVRKAEAAQKR